jgi:hypothetical protein
MPAATTHVDEETIEIPAGTFDCLRYTRAEGDALDVFWFARSEPGAPVRLEMLIGGQPVYSYTTIEITGP